MKEIQLYTICPHLQGRSHGSCNTAAALVQGYSEVEGQAAS